VAWLTCLAEIGTAVCALVGIAWTPAALAAGAAGAGIMVGALYAHLCRAHDPFPAAAPATCVGLVAAALVITSAIA
jgi:hypothetical protein